MSGTEDEATSDLSAQVTSTTDAIARSRNFLETKLMPDLEEANSFVSHLEESRNGYMRLQQELKTTLQDKVKKTSVLANLGQGVHLSVDINANSLYIISSGLKDNLQDWQSDSGLYIQLNKEEAITFTAKKVDILDRRIKMATERVALIQSHAELTTKSIDQLEQLQADPSSTIIDYLKA